MHGDPIEMGLVDGIATHEAVGTVPHDVEVQAVAAQSVALSAELEPRVRDLKEAVTCLSSVKADLCLFEVLLVACNPNLQSCIHGKSQTIRTHGRRT
jgi:hypothetical protein